jgi:hypothetical protein
VTGFTLFATDFRAACYKDLTGVVEVLVAGVPTILASCPHCRRTIITQRIASPAEDNARAMLGAYAHVERCKPWRP